ncbi:MAG: ribosome recycling factor [Gammaproteobacteria bacterium]
MEEQIEKRMQKTTDALRADLAKIRSGRAHLGLLDAVVVPCYGNDMPLAQVASVSVADARSLVVSPWDKNNTAAIEKAIRDSDLGVNPAAMGGNIRVSLPLLSEERRHDLVKVISREGETARIAIRNIRRDSIADIKTQVKDGQLSEDEGRRLEQQMQKITDACIAAADALIDEKKQELMTV